MKEIKSKAVMLTLSGTVIGMMIPVILYALGVYPDELLLHQRGFFVCQFAGSALLGAVSMGGSVVYSIESWGLRRATFTHYALALAAFLLASFLLGWWGIGLLLLFAIAGFTVAYLGIWLFQYARWKWEIDRMNRDLELFLENGRDGELS